MRATSVRLNSWVIQIRKSVFDFMIRTASEGDDEDLTHHVPR